MPIDLSKHINVDTYPDIVWPFGQFKGQTLAQIAETDRGLRYLDWVIGEKWLKNPLKGEVEAYLEKFQKDRWEELLED